MDTPLLVIGNKRYSSWSLRAWFCLKLSGAAFREQRIPLDQPDTAERISAFSPAGRLPVLVDGDLTVYDSMAILEYANEAFAGGALLPRDLGGRARARAACAEMHAGFAHLREKLPMNLGRPVSALGPDGETAAEIGRILTLWEGLLQEHQGQGPYLFGGAGLADCAYLPVVTRFYHYGVSYSAFPRAAVYGETMLAHPAFQQWREAALRETEVLPGMP